MNTNESITSENGRGKSDCCALAEYKKWLHSADQKWRRRSPYSFKWKLWGQMPLIAFKIGWMACEAWHRMKAKVHNATLTYAGKNTL